MPPLSPPPLQLVVVAGSRWSLCTVKFAHEHGHHDDHWCAAITSRYGVGVQWSGAKKICKLNSGTHSTGRMAVARSTRAEVKAGERSVHSFVGSIFKLHNAARVFLLHFRETLRKGKQKASASKSALLVFSCLRNSRAKITSSIPLLCMAK